MNAASTALDYIRRGWSVTPVHVRGKRPVHDDWPSLNISADQVPKYFSPDSNIGVVLGDISGGLVDIDLDVPEAIELAPLFLPPTQEFGRASSRRSHWVYYARGARTEKFQQLLEGGRLAMLVELRANKTGEGGQGLQTVFPGSVHESGEAIEWEATSATVPLVVKPELLRLACARLSTATMLVRLGWSEEQLTELGLESAARKLGGPDYERVARWLGLPKREAAPPARQLARDDNRIKRATAYLGKVDGAVSGAGGHQKAWGAALAVVRGFELSEAEGYDLLAREYNPRCDPPWSERELRHKVADAANNGRLERGYLLKQERPTNGARGDHPQRSNSNGVHRNSPDPEITPTGSDLTEPLPPAEWEAPLEFGAFNLPPFPIEALPPCLADFVRACAEATQTPPDLAGMLVLSACAAACAKRLVVEVVPGYQEPVNLFTVSVLPPGERKSAVMREVSAPLVAWEAAELDKLKPQIARSHQRFAVSKKRLDAAVDRASKAKSKEERRTLEMEVEDLSDQHAQLELMQEPRILADDATPEALGSLLAVHGGRIAIFSAEGGVFQQMAGKYSDSPSLDVYLKAHAGDEIRVDRKGRPPERVSDPALTLGLSVQPSVLEALADKPMLRGSGLVARFLYALPTSMLGARKIDASPIPAAVRSAYGDAVRRLLLLRESKVPLVLKLAPEALTLWREFAGWVEPQLADFGDMESIRDWAGKLPGAAIRISGVLGILGILSLKGHFEDLSISIYIRAEVMARAIALAKFFVPHAEAAISSMGAATGRVEGAKHVLKCLGRKAWTSFSRRDLERSVRRCALFAEGDAIDRALHELEERGFIRQQPPSMRGIGRPPGPTFEVNPLWGSGIPGINPQNTQNARIPGEDDE